jgi:pantoate--beta-alanine ligase
MQLWRDPDAFRRACDEARARGQTVGLVPTMGALHEGHLALVEEARRRAAFVAVTVFVNPTQFGPTEDFARYPRRLDDDREACERAGAAGVFAPEVSAMYPLGEETRVRVGRTAEPLEGAHRPGHFEGVATIVAKLFHVAGPCVAVFGKKDYQQLQVVRRMARDLLMPVEIVGLATVREPDGLAKSSRNAYLDASQRQAALSISRGLRRAVRAFEAGERDADRLTAIAREPVALAASSIDYVAVADADTVEPLPPGARVADRALLAVAARFGGARLIDNVVLGEDALPPGEAPGGETTDA